MIRLFSFLLLPILFIQCSQDPVSTGYQAIPPIDSIGVLTYDSKTVNNSVRTSSFFYSSTHALSDILSIGKADGYEASILFRFFGFPDSNAGGGRILSARLELCAAPYALGNKNSNLSFEIKQIRTLWNAGQITADSLAKLTTDPQIKGSYSGILPDSGKIFLDLDSTMVREWYMAYRDSQSIYGMILAPTANCTAFRSFYSSEKDSTWQRPTLTLIREMNGKIDTLQIQYETSSTKAVDTYVVTGPAKNTFSPFFVHGALAYRGTLRFDVSSIPPNSTINHVELLVTRNRAASKLNFRAVDTLIVQEDLDTTTHTTATVGLFSLKKSDDVYSFAGTPLIKAVQEWVNKPASNNGLVMSTSYEASDLDYYSLFGAEADTTKRPRFIIRYTKKP